jgi:hypothetical protein
VVLCTSGALAGMTLIRLAASRPHSLLHPASYSRKLLPTSLIYGSFEGYSHVVKGGR